MSEWDQLRRYTSARIGLPRAGSSVSTRELLSFQLAHARARDAVLHAWDIDACSRALQEAGVDHRLASSRARDRQSYLRRPDLGRQLDPESVAELGRLGSDPAPDVALVLSDGLSATAAQWHGVETVRALLTALGRRGLRSSPLVLVRNARVALSDEVGQALGARAAVIVIGERPGLSAADSLGLYLTYGPKRGNTDAGRNCISNVREPGGLSPLMAAEQLAALLIRALDQGLSGVGLKAEALPALAHAEARELTPSSLSGRERQR